MNPELFDEIEATLSPMPFGVLRPGIDALIGKRYRWRYIGVQDSPDWRYYGQTMWEPAQHLPPVAWVPLSDLAEVTCGDPKERRAV